MIQTSLDLATVAPASCASTPPVHKAVTDAVALNGVAPNRVPAGQTIVIPPVRTGLKSHRCPRANIHTVHPAAIKDTVVSLTAGLITQTRLQGGLVWTARVGCRTVDFVSISIDLKVEPVVATHMHRIREKPEEPLSSLYDQEQDGDKYKQKYIHYLFPIF
jgi:hypothetical protein